MWDYIDKITPKQTIIPKTRKIYNFTHIKNDYIGGITKISMNGSEINPHWKEKSSFLYDPWRKLRTHSINYDNYKF